MHRTMHDTTMTFPMVLVIDEFGDMALVVNPLLYFTFGDSWERVQNDLIAAGEEEVRRGRRSVLRLAG